MRAQDADKPWFMYYSTGCAHAPHQVPSEWSEKYRGRFDRAGIAYREETFERQKELGVIPADAELTPRPRRASRRGTRSPDDERTLYARQMEVYAGFQENADWNVGRLLDAVEEMGELDNTLVIYICGDNGASMEGTLTGSFNELTMQNGIPLTPEQQLELIEQYGGLDAWGTELSPRTTPPPGRGPGTPVPVGQAGRVAPGRHPQRMVVRWPTRITDAGGIRSQFTHCIDVGPTILEVAGMPDADECRRHRAEADAGHQLRCTPSTTPTPPSATPQQYFEIYGNRAMYKDGWWAACMLDRIPWDVSPPTMARFAPGVVRPRAATPGSCTTCPTTSARRRTSPAEHPAKVAELQGAVLAGGGEVQRAAAAGRVLGVLRDPAADADGQTHTVLRRRAEHRVRA